MDSSGTGPGATDHSAPALGGATDGESALLAGVGASIAWHRRAVGMTQTELAQQVNRSFGWVSAVEQGRRHADRLHDLVSIANALRIPLEDLIGCPINELTPGTERPHSAAVAAIRQTIMRAADPTWPGQGTRTDAAPTIADVQADVRGAWDTWHAAPNAIRDLGLTLPRLLTNAHRVRFNTVSGTPEERSQAAAALASAYQVTRQWLHHTQGVADLTWVTAERANTTALEADDPLLIALGAWALSGPYRRAGQQDEATRLCLAAADRLKPVLDAANGNPDQRLLAAWGMLHLSASVSAAQADEDGRAWSLHRTAQETAQSLGADFYDPWTKFGIGNVNVHGISLYAELGRPDDVVELSSRTNIDVIPSVERRSTSLIAVARGYVGRGEDEAAVLVLLDAEKISPDNVQHSNVARELVRQLAVQDRARARQHVRSLAARIGLLAS